MVFGIGQDARDHATLVGDTQAFFGAQGFKIDMTRHAADVGASRLLRKGIVSRNKPDRLTLEPLPVAGGAVAGA
ncbi:hypothetical protein GCM10008023_14640 [Sphingomonas glacialis]|uniref:Uncharacterized protein n=1 Tax=Sphingomonas glacialis TaxID=658225 RepID=A0ABQ3LEB7_9SPHN|nr:hypothetical protein GCM10008023_14640 [Sphingomonas glacialis]